MFDDLYRQTYLEEQVPMGSSRQFTFDQINPFLNKYILNPNSVFYNEDPDFTASQSSVLSMDLANKIVTINATAEVEPGGRYEWFTYQYNKGLAQYRRQFPISYFVSAEGDHDTELGADKIPDPELRRFLRNNYDKDGNGIITEYDMINIDRLFISGVDNFKGLEYAINLKSLTINCTDNGPTNLNSISGLIKMEDLTIFNISSADFSIFSSMNKLNSLNIRGIRTVSNASSLNALNTLRILDLTFVNQSEISKLSALTDKANFGLAIGLESEDYIQPVTNEHIEEAV